MKLVIIYGTRPEFLKLKVLIDTLRQKSINHKVIRINQHIHFSEDNGYYDENIQINDLTTERLSNIGIGILKALPSFIYDCTHVLSQGDTATVFYSLLCAFQMKKKCIHLEAGMRTYDIYNPYPEEGFRQMISRITDIHLCPSELEMKYLNIENVNGKYYIIGNTILDLVKSYNIPVTYTKTIIITLHRRENWDTFKEYIQEIFLLASKNTEYIFYFFTHPNPSLQTILNELLLIKPSNINIMESVTHYQMIQKLSSCAVVITDSGGIQEEANFLGKHMYVLRKITERASINDERITLCDLDDIKNIDCTKQNYSPGYEYGNGQSSIKIYEILESLVDT
jgi:UDP-N-acetylglucosamine 2-epimerase (non-hydrolysing)